MGSEMCIRDRLDWVPESPTYFYHGIGDDIVPYENAQMAYDAFIENGASNVTLELFAEELGGHSALALPCLLAGYNVILDYQVISPKGDMNSDGLVSLIDLALLSESLLVEYNMTDFEWWAGDCDYDHHHSVVDILMVADIID